MIDRKESWKSNMYLRELEGEDSVVLRWLSIVNNYLDVGLRDISV